MDETTSERHPDEGREPEPQPRAAVERGGGPASAGLTNAAIGLLGLMVTGGGLWLAARQAETTATEVLAGSTAGAGTLAVAVAVFGAVRAINLRSGLASTAVAGVLSVTGLILAAVTGLIAAHDEPSVPERPQANVALAAGVPGTWTLTVQVSIPGLAPGDMMDAKLTGIDDAGGELALGRSLTTADRAGVATATLVTTQVSSGDVKLDVHAGGQVCTQRLPLLDATRIAPLSCEAE
ncbi:hypothetical protein [Actinoplanes regularis]|uniref:hypothetical protein n=1 Tax=Actinoplanes regularis TaxID=52697 RepID=UPI0024A50347|nr:hypothetical protein [Actinoplanes regularis]GLW36041.1 hypothetical protein Areg01_89760 [Actinoplanes regularis]